MLCFGGTADKGDRPRSGAERTAHHTDIECANDKCELWNRMKESKERLGWEGPRRPPKEVMFQRRLRNCVELTLMKWE